MQKEKIVNAPFKFLRPKDINTLRWCNASNGMPNVTTVTFSLRTRRDENWEKVRFSLLEKV